MYFKTSKQALDTRIFHTVDSDTSAYVKSYTEGIRRVKDGDGAYAFIAESLSLGELFQYIVHKWLQSFNCPIVHNFILVIALAWDCTHSV